LPRARDVLALACLLALPLAAFGEVALRRQSLGDPQTLDPQLWVYGQDGNLAQDLFQGLTTVDAGANAVPGQAESWQVSADGKTYTFRLRVGLQWSDGKPIDSRDFLWSMRRLFDPRTASPSASLLYVIRNARAVNTGKKPATELGVRIPDARTVVIELEHPAPYFTDIIVHRAFPVPRHVVERFGRDWTRAGNHVSNGAFTLGEWRPNAFVKLVRNPRFHAARTVKLDAVYHIPIEDPNVALTRFRAGQLDIVVSLPSEKLDDARRDYPRELHLVPQIGLEYYVINNKRPPFNDLRVRRALSLAVDRDTLTRLVLRAGEKPAYCIVPSGVRNYRPQQCLSGAAMPPVMPARLQLAKQLLAQAGFAADNPLHVNLHVNNNDTQKRIAVTIQAMWRAAGIRAQLLSSELKVHQTSMQQGDYDVARTQWYAEDRDAASFLELLDSRAAGINVSRYANAKFEALLDQADATADLTHRAELLLQAERLALQDQPLIPLYYYVSRRLISQRVVGWQDNVRGVHINRYFSLKP
jgi:oligopeptide transport system substrate-binding protein